MGNLQSRSNHTIEIYWGRERLVAHRISWFTARFPVNSHLRPYIKWSSPVRGYFYLDLAPRENDAAPWLTGWRGSYHSRSKCNASLREAVELLLEDRMGSHNFNIGHLFQNDNGRRVHVPISKFQDLIEALVTIAISFGCLTGGSRPILRGLKSAYTGHRSFLKYNATIPEAVRFLSIGHMLKSSQMIHDFMFTVLSGFEAAFPKSRTNDGAGAGHGTHHRDCRGISRELWEYLKRQHNEYQHRKRERERRLRDYIADMGNISDNSILLSVRPSAVVDLVSSASTSVKSRPQSWETQNHGKRGQVIVEVKTLGNDSHRTQRDPNREHERHYDRVQFERALAQHMNQFAQEEMQRRYDGFLPWEVHVRGECRRPERHFRGERYGLNAHDELDRDASSVHV
ncbi:hypothetical protein C7212DRAFT_329686 [Tuber magnatum]|uniref:Uncharacterized protein n=1 Tax=Tuber magnatum TaxID=42249 RepID=A0A317SHM0_9PEZI|nr:hypothetical protein C7212DRAFT_329686 [Tuber magnatum]